MPDDITPLHHPISLLRSALERAEGGGYDACLVVLIDDDGRLWYESCGTKTQTVLWALESMKHVILRDAHDDE